MGVKPKIETIKHTMNIESNSFRLGSMLSGGGNINLKTQTITKTLSLKSGEVKTLTFTFNELTTVCGISDITRTKTSNAYGQYQDINGRYDNPHSFFTITGNTVVIEIQGYVDTSSEAQWSVTAVGK